MSFVGLGLPYVALGIERLFGDSGFLCIYEPLVEIFKQTGNKSLIYLDKRYAGKFEEQNNPEVTGVYPVYSTDTRCPSKAVDQGIDDTAANLYLDCKCPIDYIITNKNYVLPHLVASALSSKGMGVPVVYVCLNAGKDAVTKPVSRVQNTLHDIQVNDASQFYLFMEAATYMTASYVVWTTEDQRRRGMDIAKRFLAGVEVARLKKKSMVNGCGITDLVRPYQKSDEQVRREFQTPKQNFSVTFLGRITHNKNVGSILDTMQPLFARYGTKLDMKMTKELPNASRFAENDDPENMISAAMFEGGFASTEDYASRLLPSIQCMLYASIAEGYCITPREAVYIGVPVLVPRRPWAETAFGTQYPFYYSSHDQAFSIIKRIEEGKITDAEVDGFLQTRSNGFTCEFLSQVSAKLFSVCKSLAEERRREFSKMSHSKLISVFEETIGVGTSMPMQLLYKAFGKNGLTIGDGNSKRALTPSEVYAFLGDRMECVNPVSGIFRRIS